MILCLVFFLSGASALLFETIWFRLVGLMLGNSVWASSVVLAGFMGGLAVGNGLVARRGRRLTRLVRSYALLELVVAASGFGLVLLLPRLGGALAPLLRRFLDDGLWLNGLRLSIAFALLALPTACMGATLPILVKAMTRERPGFGGALGRLYGWNTLGACAGALAGEGLLIGLLGLRGSGAFAALLNGLAALLAIRFVPEPAERAANDPPPAAPGAAPRRLLAGAFLAGALLLALEVVWFRFLLLFTHGTSLAFATLLAVVLLGIASGGLLAAGAASRIGEPGRAAASVALLAGAFVGLLYRAFALALQPLGPPYVAAGPRELLPLALALMGPVALLSGALFTLQGAALRRERRDDTEAAGALTLANTLGAMLGALAAGFLLLPRFGMERSLFALSAGYGLVAWAALPRGSPLPRSRRLAVAALGFALGLLFFPFGLMRERFLRLASERHADDGSRLVAVREGLAQTILYQRKELWGEPLYYRLVTNATSMAGTEPFARRYMTLFVSWPTALAPEPRRALLVGFGAGTTARALTRVASLDTIDVVDISPEILEMGRIAYPQPGSFPLDDRRVRVHVEDGRFFLLASDRRFDLITSEPPPLDDAGVVNLYSREYFELLRERLAPGGFATYWLPVADLRLPDTLAIVKAFCAAFEDCSLWNGAELDWMLAGSNAARGPVDAGRFRQQWDDPATRDELAAVGIETPEQLGALFIGDARFLAELTRGVEPVTDDWPARLSARAPARPDPLYFAIMDTRLTRRRFETSSFIAERWPAALRSGTLAAFDQQALVNQTFHAATGLRTIGDIAAIREVLRSTSLRTLPLMLLESGVDEQRLAAKAAARGVRDPLLDLKLGVGALAARDYRAAEALFARAQASGAALPLVDAYRSLAAQLGGQGAR